MKYANFIAAFGTIAIATSSFAPFASAADINVDTRATLQVNEIKADVALGVCVAVERMQVSLGEQWRNLQLRLDVKRDEIIAKINIEEKNRDQDVSIERDREDAKIANINADLKIVADTDAEHAAIVVFQADIRAAVTARRKALDAANTTFRAGIKAAHESRRIAVAAAIKKYSTAINAAFAKAKADCARSVAPATVKEQLAASVRAAKLTLQADLQAIDTMGKRVQPLITARRAAHAKAQADFQTSLEAAKAKLKLVFVANATAETN